ncbi:hypothetical protein [Scytonema sp. PRP1]
MVQLQTQTLTLEEFIKGLDKTKTVINTSIDFLQKCLKCHVERSRSVPEA